jgi:hypothetical protein
MNQKVRGDEGPKLNGIWSAAFSSRWKAGAYVQRQTATAERSNRRTALTSEQVTSRKPHDGRIVSEANAWSNVQDMLTETQ